MRTKTIYILTIMTILSYNLIGQTVSDFENLPLAVDTFWNGESSPLGTSFSSGNAAFPSYYDTSFGGFWAEGWAYTSMRDSTTPGFGNQYSAITAIGVNNSQNYAVAQAGAVVKLTGNASGRVVGGVYITNSTYAYLAVRDGDLFARKFGDTTGTNSGLPQGSYPDWFKLTIKKWHGGMLSNDSINYFLADYRFSDDSQDYIVKEWAFVDLSSLGNADSLLFTLSSSDVGQFGMNTPKYFCIDNLTTTDIPSATIELSNSNDLIEMFPNPASDLLTIITKSQNTSILIFNVSGNMVFSEILKSDNQVISISDLPNGLYHVQIVSGNSISTSQFIKNQ